MTDSLRYLSLFSGIEACTMAWHELGWEPVAFCEFDAFPSAVLAHHYPKVPNLGDVTQITDDQIKALGRIDVVVGGSPCQDLSVAGKRAGLSGERSGLFHEQLRIFHAARSFCGARFLLWENVPGAYSSHKGRDFALVAGEMAGCRLSVPRNKWQTAGACLGPNGLVEWRCLDAQYVRVESFPGAVPQRRRRVFALLDTGDWASRPPILLEPEGLQGHPPPRREAGETTAQSVAPCIGASGRGFERAGETRGQDPVVATGATIPGTDKTASTTAVVQPIAWTEELTASIGVAGTIQRGGSGGRHDGVAVPIQPIAHTLTQRYDSSEDGCGRGTPLVPEVCGTLSDGAHMGGGLNGQDAYSGRVIPVAFHNRQDLDISGDVTHPLGSMDNGMAVAYGFKRGQGEKAGSLGYDKEVCPTLTGVESGTQNPPGIHSGMAVRRLTPIECERLQGFPDNFTRIPWRGKPAENCPDGPRYKALGNSMAVNVMAWIGRRVAEVCND